MRALYSCCLNKKFGSKSKVTKYNKYLNKVREQNKLNIVRIISEMSILVQIEIYVILVKIVIIICDFFFLSKFYYGTTKDLRHLTVVLCLTN